MRYRLTLSYDGSKYSGWQVQDNAATVQGELDRALGILFGENVRATGAGRTDTGVNAIGYVCHFDVSEAGRDKAPHDKSDAIYKINAILPRGIVVHDIAPAADSFNARFSAKSREYRYFVHRVKDPFAERFSYFCRYPLNIDKMNLACAHLLGRHDFSCFEKTGGSNATSICTVYEACWESYVPTHVGLMGFGDGDARVGYDLGDRYVVFRIKADRFLRNMVRAIVGSLLEVGRGKREPEWIGSLVAEGTRCDAGESVPGYALFLCEIKY